MMPQKELPSRLLKAVLIEIRGSAHFSAFVKTRMTMEEIVKGANKSRRDDGTRKSEVVRTWPKRKIWL